MYIISFKSIVISPLQMRKPKHSQIKEHAQSLTANNW